MMMTEGCVTDIFLVSSEPVYMYIHSFMRILKVLFPYFNIIAPRFSRGKPGVVGESSGRLSQEDASEEEEEGEVVPH